MEKPSIGETQKTIGEDVDNGVKLKETMEAGEHAEVVAFVEKHRDFFEHYAQGRVKISPAPKGVKTFGFDLKDDEIYVSSFFRERGYDEEKTLFAVCHEIEHFLEKRTLLEEDGGGKIFEKFLQRKKGSKAFSLMENLIGDIRENRSVVQKTNQGMRELEEKIYKEDLFPESDFTAQPRHLQFCQAILREARVPGEQCQVSPEVRDMLDEVAKIRGLMDIMTNPGTPMSTRLKLQDKYIWPKVEELLKKDLEDKKNQKEQNKEEKGQGKKENGSDESGEGNEGNESGEERDETEGAEDKKQEEKKIKRGKSDKAEEKEIKSSEDDGEQGGEETNPDKIFADDYAKVEKKFPEAIPVEEVEKAFKEWKEFKESQSGADKADEDYAREIGVDKKDLQNYRKIVEDLQKIINPETDMTLVEELKKLFSRIIAKRLKIAQAPKYPVEEGDELVDPAQLVAEVKAGNLKPKVWEDTEIKEKKGDRFGEIEITLVCDRSNSMEGQKAEEQRKSAVLMLEVLKEFAELCEEERINIDKPLEVRSEIYSFASSSEDRIPLKKMSPELGEAERINVLKKLYDVPGSTTDFNCLEAIDNGLDEQTKTKIKIGELKKIVIVFTDGGSDDPARVQGVLKSLRDVGVVVIGVGITQEGVSVLTTYAPEALVIDNVTKLPLILAELLKEHLKDL